MCTMSTHYSEFVLVFPAMELLIRRCQWYICKNQRMVSLDSDYDEALDVDVVHTIRADSGQQAEGYSSQLGAPENDTIAVTKV